MAHSAILAAIHELQTSFKNQLLTTNVLLRELMTSFDTHLAHLESTVPKSDFLLPPDAQPLLTPGPPPPPPILFSHSPPPPSPPPTPLPVSSFPSPPPSPTNSIPLHSLLPLLPQSLPTPPPPHPPPIISRSEFRWPLNPQTVSPLLPTAHTHPQFPPPKQPPHPLLPSQVNFVSFFSSSTDVDTNPPRITPPFFTEPESLPPLPPLVLEPPPMPYPPMPPILPPLICFNKLQDMANFEKDQLLGLYIRPISLDEEPNSFLILRHNMNGPNSVISAAQSYQILKIGTWPKFSAGEPTLFTLLEPGPIPRPPASSPVLQPNSSFHTITIANDVLAITGHIVQLGGEPPPKTFRRHSP